MRSKLATILAMMVFWSMSLCAEGFIGEVIDEELEVTYSYYQNEWIMGLGDGSSWKLMPLKEKRKQTWTEWWSGTEPKEWGLSDEFYFDPNNWKGKYRVSVYFAHDSLSKGYDYIIVNENTNQKAFAKFIPYGSDFIPKTEYAAKIIESTEPDSSAVLSSYPYLDDILVLQDDSVWKVYLKTENMRSFSEWWNGLEIDQPDEEFVSKLGEWKPNDQIEIYHAEVDDQEINQKYNVSKSLREIYLIKNKTRQKMAFASEVPLNDLLDNLESYAHSQHDKGHTKGFSEGFNRGFKDGQSKGFKEGYQLGVNDSKHDHSEK